MWTENVSVAGINVTNQYFSPVYNISTEFGNEVIDGILGLGLASLSNLKQVNWMSQLVHAGLLLMLTFLESILRQCEGAGSSEERHVWS